MKTLLFLTLSLCLFLNVTAQTTAISNYYFSSTTGDDSRTPIDALNPATPWKTIAKLNSIMTSLKAGDSILFKRGDTFTGAIKMDVSGTATQPVIFSAYGTGTKPVINGFAMLSSWTPLENGIWETSCASGANLNLVILNETGIGMGRFPNLTDPNRGFLTLESHSGTSQLTDNELGSSVNWTGAEIVVRKNDWVLDRGLITGQSGNTLDFVSPTGHQPTDGYGYFIQNSPLALDQKGEWYYNPSTEKLRMYFGTENPDSNVIKAGIVDTLIYINGKSYLTFDNLSFRGADVEAFRITNCSNIRIQQSDFNNTGLDAISVDNSPYMTIENNTVNHSNNSGIRLYSGSNYATIKNNAVRNSGLIPGMGSSNNQQHDGIFVDSSPMNVIESNTVDSSGYCGIVFTGTNISVRNNFVNNFCLTVNDGGGIYTWGGWDKTGRVVANNVVINGIGAPGGTNSTTPGGAVGIYTDDRSTHIDILNNTIANCSRAGIYLHNSHEMNLTNNTLYNNGIQLSMVHDALEPADPIRNNVTTNNIMSSNKASQFLVENNSMLDDIASFGSYDNNYYVRPMDNNGIISTSTVVNGEGKNDFFALSGWSTKFNYDVHSSKSPVSIPKYSVNQLIGANKFVNGSFNSNVDGVTVNSSPGTATGSFNSGKLDGGALQVSFDASGGATNNVGTYIDFGNITEGKTYIIKFSLLSGAAGKTLKGFILQNGGSYTRLSETKYFELTTTRTENEFLFTAPSTQTNTMIALELAGTDCPFWLDNFQVFEADVTMTNPDDYMRFDYNGSSVSRSVALDGTYVDAKNQAFSGTITLAPYSSIILMRQALAATATTTQTGSTMPSALTATEAASIQTREVAAMTVKVSPNPTHEKLQVAVDLPTGTKAASMSIYSLAGVKLKTMTLSGTSSVVPVDVSNFSNGMYIVNIVYDGHLSTRKFIKQ